VIARHADENGYEIVQTYADEGKSGVNLGGCAGLQQVVKDFEEGSADCRALMVHDVRRLGRSCRAPAAPAIPLKEQKSNSYDGTLEYYYRRGYVALARHYRNISDRVISSAVNETIGGSDYSVTRPRNLGSATL
jgi:hypothetical protein